MKILIVEDDKNTAQFIQQGLIEAGHNVDHFISGADGLYAATTNSYDVIVLDRMIPEVDGLKIVKILRGTNNFTPVIFLTAMNDIDERVNGLNSGADDYLVKPFAFSELLARVNNIAKRSTPNAEKPEISNLSIADLNVDLINRKVTRADKEIDLKTKEFNILVYFLKNPGKIITRTMLLEQIWNYHFSPQTNVIDVHIFNLRKKIDGDFDKPLLKTIRGVGYKLDEN